MLRIVSVRARRAGLQIITALAMLQIMFGGARGADAPSNPFNIVDLSLLVSNDYPCVWPVAMPRYLLVPDQRIGPGPYNRDTVYIDEHTGTQWDAPAHFVPPPNSGLPNAGPMGARTSDKVPVWQFVGEACVLDLRQHVDDAAKGASYLIPPDMVTAWEKSHRRLGPGDVFLMRSDYSDKYYQRFPAGDRFVALPVGEKTPGWPGPMPQTMELLASRDISAAGLDSPSMGPLPNLAAPVHLAGGKHGLIWTEGCIGLGQLPDTGACYVLLAPKHAAGSGTEARALAITEPKIAAELLERVRAKRVADLSVLLDENLPISWPGVEVGTQASPYLGKTLHYYDQPGGVHLARTHILDCQAGTHLVPPSFALPEPGFDNQRYAPSIQEALAKYEAKYGPRGTSTVTAESVPLSQLIGRARVIDVSHLLGKIESTRWPASPRITLDEIRKHESQHGPLAAGEIVIFRSGYSDAHCRPFPEGDRMLVEPLKGKAEAWPAPDLDVVAYLADKQIRCIATDGPALGSVVANEALPLYWLAGSRGMCIVEYLTGLGQLPPKGAFFLFAPVKQVGNHGGHGRALALY